MYPPTFQFRKPPDTPPKDYPFNLDIFTKSTGYNILTKAIRTQFDKCGVIDTAWEYFTLARSYDPYQVLIWKPAKVYTISYISNDLIFSMYMQSFKFLSMLM